MSDFYGKDATKLKDKKLWLLDMDGTIYLGNQIFKGTLPFLEKVTKDQNLYRFLTNNSSKGVEDYVKKVTKMGIQAGPEHFFTSVDATILYLKKNFKDQLVYAQGTRSLIQNLTSAGVPLTEEVTDEAKIVLVGFDTELDFKKMEKTCEMLRKDVHYIATNPDFVCPVEGGYVPDCGSMCIGYEYATGKKPKYIGKPEPDMILTVCEMLNIKKEDAVLVGDRLYTDIQSGINAGIDTILVLSGEATEKDYNEYPEKPSFVFQDIEEVLNELLQ